MFDHDLAELAQRVRSGATLRVFLALPVRLDFETWRRVDQKELATELSMEQPTVSRALKELHSLGVIARRGSGPLVTWKFNTTIGWRGNVASYHTAKRRQERAESGEPATIECRRRYIMQPSAGEAGRMVA